MKKKKGLSLSKVKFKNLEYETKKCVVCGKSRISFYTGHVRHPMGSVFAGFCTQKCCDETSFTVGGCAGDWKSKMGIKETEQEEI